jgi:hypothetical protein
MMAKRKKQGLRTFTGADGTVWGVEVMLPSHSSAMIVFHHPDGTTARRDRYNWINADVPDARDVKARLDPAAVLASIADQQLALLFRRSMAISAADDPSRSPVTNLAVQSS